MRWVMSAGWVLGLALGAVNAHAAGLNLGVAVMDASSAGLTPQEVEGLTGHVRKAVAPLLKGTDFFLVKAEELAAIQKELPRCRVGACDLQVAKRQGAEVAVSVEAALVKGEYSLSLRMFEVREGALLGRAAPVGKTLKELDALVPAATQSVVDTLKAAHAAAVAAIRTPQDRYLLRAPGAASADAAPVAATVTQRSAGRLLIEDGEQVHLEKVLASVRSEVNACYETLLNKKAAAKGRMTVVLDVEPDGHVSYVEMSEDTVQNQDMQECVKARLRRARFSSMEKPFRVSFPLVFVRNKK